MNSIYQDFIKKAQIVLEKIKDLTYLGNPILSEKTKFSSYEKAIKVCKELEINLKKIRDITGVGRGLASSQIGSNERCFVTFVDDKFQYFINPFITKTSDTKNWYRENCLSCGPIVCNVQRPESIALSYIDKDNNQKEEEFDGFWARLLQHEFDHLEGIVNVYKTDPNNISIITNDPLKEELRDSK
jgi:peptide deformylase